MNTFDQSKNSKIAIVGMDCFLGNYKGLDAFERSIYEGHQDFVNSSSQQQEKQVKSPKRQSFNDSTTSLDSSNNDLPIDFSVSPLILNESDKLNSQELLILQVTNNALKDAKLDKGNRVAVIIVTSTEYAHCLPKQEEQDTISPLKANTNSSIDINDIFASRISKLWNFAGLSLTLAIKQNSIFKVLDVAQKLLSTREVNAVVIGSFELAENSASLLASDSKATINTGVNTLSYDQNANGWMVGEGAAALVLKLYATAQQDHDRIYAVIDALELLKHPSPSNNVPNPEAVTQVCHGAFRLAGIKSTDVGYLEVLNTGVPEHEEIEIRGLIEAYQAANTNLKTHLSCALGSVKANIGHTYAVSRLASLIKTALCLYYRYIPAVPQWSGPKMPELWQGSPFYVAVDSKPWFLEKGQTKRIAAINSTELDGRYAHLILSEELTQTNRDSRYLEQMPFYLFTLAADDCSGLLEQLHTLQQTIEDTSSLATAACLIFSNFRKRQKANYTLAILGHNYDELRREIQSALKGVTNAFKTGKDWQTPIGSYFTPKPLGKKGALTFVYPGAYSSYIGIARNLFRLFPKIYDDPVIASVYNRVASIEKLLYPRSLSKLSHRQLEVLEQQLMDDPITMLESEIGVAGLLSAILKNYFQLQPQYAFGYSLGETSMMFAQGIWNDVDESSQSFNSSPLFKTRLSGPKHAVREYWRLPIGETDESTDFWSTYILMCPAIQVREVLKHENRVYLSLINTPEEVVIGGDTKACERVIDTLKCNAFQAPFNHVIHCDAIRSEYDELVKLNTLPIRNIPKTVFYFAAEYQPIILDSRSLGHTIAQMLCQQVNFPRLIHRVWEDGARIFVEVGAGSNCLRWIDKSLKEKEHLSVSFNKRGLDDHTSIIKALAKLFSHQVEMDLTPLYSHTSTIIRKDQFKNKDHCIDGSNSNSVSLDKEEQKICQDTVTDYLSSKAEQQNLKIFSSGENEHMTFHLNQPAVETLEYTETPQSFKVAPEEQETYEYCASALSPHLDKHRFSDELQTISLRNPLYQKLNENISHTSTNHAIFLQNRQNCLKQISEIIQLQLAYLQQILENESQIQILEKSTNNKSIIH